MIAPLVDIHQLVKVYEPSPWWVRALVRTPLRETVTALDTVTFTVRPGQIRAVLGPNGAGKSTLFRILTGLTTPTSGTARIAGLDVTRRSHRVRRLLGYVPADSRSILLRQTGRDNLEFRARIHGFRGEAMHRRIADVGEVTGIGPALDRAAFTYSSGMLARLMLARALLTRPRVLILDEPTAAVDPVGSYELLQVLQTVTREQGLAVLLSSHRLEEIEALRDAVVVLDRGRIVFDGDLDAFRERFEDRRLHLDFPTPARAVDASLVLVRAGFDAQYDEATVTVTTHVATGRVLEALGGLASSLVAVRHDRAPLQQLLAGMLAAHRSPTAADVPSGAP